MEDTNKIAAELKKFADKVSILYVEDSKTILHFVNSNVKSLLPLTDTAINGRDGLEKFCQKKYDIVISDIYMPEMNGIEMIKKIKTITPEQIIVVTSASDEAACMVELINLEVTNFLIKPVQPDKLYQLLLKLCRQLEAQQKLKEYQQFLEKLVEEKTEEVNRMYEKLQLLDSDKMRFINYLSHEINTPLSFIMSSQLIDREGLSEDNLELLTIIEEGYDRLNAFMLAVLKYFEMAGMQLEISREKINLSKLVSGIVLESLTKIADRDICINNLIREDIILNTDQTILSSALRTVIENSIDFSENEGVVTLDCQSLEDGRQAITVTDTGKGIPAENLKDIFKPFLVDESQRKPDGYGLNLPLVKIQLRQVDGHIRAESEGLGSGARFVIEI